MGDEELEVISEVVSPEVYGESVVLVDCSKLNVDSNGVINGQLLINMKGGSVKPFFGIFDKDEFEGEYGFRLCVLNDNASSD